LSLAVAGMAVEGARRRELTQLVAGGVLGDEHRNELASVVRREREADHVGGDGRAARPGLDDALLAGLDHGSYLLHQMEVHEGTFFHRPCHAGVLPSGLVDSSRYFALRRWRMNLLVRLLCLVLYPLVGFPQGVCGWLPFERPSPPPCGSPPPPAVRMIAGIHRDAAHVRPAPEPPHPPCLAVRQVLVLEIAHLPDGGTARETHAPQLRRRQLQERVVALLRHQLDRRP